MLRVTVSFLLVLFGTMMIGYSFFDDSVITTITLLILVVILITSEILERNRG